MKKIFMSSVFVVTLLGMSVVTHAATLASGALSGGPGASAAACYVFNAGTVPITFVSPRIRLHAQFDPPAPPSSSTIVAQRWPQGISVASAPIF